MRSDLVFGAMKQVSNRFLIAKALAKATRGFHKPGTRIEDTTNDVSIRFDGANPIAHGDAIGDGFDASAKNMRSTITGP
jgi:hypothetical protein